MKTPVFRVEPSSFLALEHANYKLGERKLFGPIARFYIDGKLAYWAGYDICAFIEGEIIDAPQQDAILISEDGKTSVPCQIVMIPFGKKRNKRAAYLVIPGKEEEMRARQDLIRTYENRNSLFDGM